MQMASSQTGMQMAGVCVTFHACNLLASWAEYKWSMKKERIAFEAIIRPAILEVANQFLLLGVNGDDGLLLGRRCNDFCADVFELGVSVGSESLHHSLLN